MKTLQPIEHRDKHKSISTCVFQTAPVLIPSEIFGVQEGEDFRTYQTVDMWPIRSEADCESECEKPGMYRVMVRSVA